MKCIKCGKEFEGNFCPACGAPKPVAPIEPKPVAPVEPKPVTPAPVAVKDPTPVTPAPAMVKEPAPAPAMVQPPRPVAPAQPQKPTAPAQPQSPAPAPAAKPKKKFPVALLIIIIVVVIGLGVGGFFGIRTLMDSMSPSNQVLSALEDNDFDKAISLSKDIEEPGQELINVLNQRIDDAYAQYKDGTIDYESAKTELENIEKLGISEVSTKLIDTEAKIEALNDSKEAFETAQGFEDDGNYISAINQYKLVIEEDSNYEDALENMSDCVDKYRDEILNEAEAYAKNDDYPNALNTLNAALNIIEDDAKISAQITLYTDTYEADTLKKAEKLITEKKYEEAEEIINSTMAVIGETDKLTKKLEEIGKSKPVDLFDTDVLYDGSNMTIIKSTDEKSFTMGRTDYTEGFILYSYHGTGYALFDLQKEYSTLTFDVGRVTDNLHKTDVTLKVYLDGEFATEYKLDASAPPKTLTIKLNNAESLKLVVENSKYDGVNYGFVNAVLTP